jgi:competence protein ComEA
MRLCAVVYASLLVSLLNAQDLPDKKGRDVVFKVCASCHGTEQFDSMRMAKEQWSSVVNDMIGRGANPTNEEFDAVVAYLSTWLGPQTNVNKATTQELQDGLSLSQKDAEAIVKTREQKGPFKTLDDLKMVPGVDASKIDQRKNDIAF